MNTDSERTVVVTGASAGVGRAVARAFGGRGDKVALLARGRAGLDQAAEEIRAAGGTAISVPTDVADPDAVEAAADRAEAELGPIDVWVNNACTTVFAPFGNTGMDEFRRVTEVTYLGAVYGTRAALDRMAPRDAGAIVQVGSALAHRGIPLQAAYCGAKHALEGFTEALRSELLHDGSNVNLTVVQLPALNTPQFDWSLSRMPNRAQPVPPIYQPEVAADAIVYAADHPQRRQYWVGASTTGTLVADRFAPRLLDRYLGRRGYDDQQTETPADGDLLAKLWEPLDDDRDFGAHGRFDDEARDSSAQASLARHRVAAAAVTGAMAAAAGVGWAIRSARAARPPPPGGARRGAGAGGPPAAAAAHPED
jgi:NAD(P)-dependent dehydrogenase (short-subunit alcohol dehydrogenase family)